MVGVVVSETAHKRELLPDKKDRVWEGTMRSAAGRLTQLPGARTRWWVGPPGHHLGRDLQGQQGKREVVGVRLGGEHNACRRWCNSPGCLTSTGFFWS